MDWFVEADDREAVGALRNEVGGYFRRHAEEVSDAAGAELAFTELLTNSIRHAPGPTWVRLDWSARQPVVEIHDLGPGFEFRPQLPAEPFAAGGRGLFIANHLAGELTVAAKRAGGSKVTATLPVTRQVERNHDPAPPATPSLPAPEEASDDGTFGKESFLRALVVEMARAVEIDQGPDATEAVVAQVGAAIGERMEEEYRRARAIVGDLSAEQIADLYVRLKAAIGGGFYVIEATPQRIVLGNTACPFGDVVKRAPGLCRMTSSVFGGIAARNSGGASVALEERIAVGDPECRIVVWLEEPDRGDANVRHNYRAAVQNGS